MDLPPFSNSAQDASDVIRDYCGWHIWPELTETLTLDGRGGRFLFLPTLRLASVVSISETRRGEAPTTLVADTDFYWSADGTIERLGACWTTRPRGITITFTHGLSTLPSVLERVAESVGVRLAGNPQRLRQASLGSRQVTYETQTGSAGLLLSEAASVERYRRIT